MDADDVIFALASGAGRAGVAVIRISGDGAGAVFPALTGRPPPAPRVASLRRLADPADGAPIDQALTLWFPAPGSFTGENVAELHLHGGASVIDGVTGALGGLPRFRPAEAGEFTRRAFRNGKLDLAEAEGLADLIDADTAAGRRQAIWQMQGGLSAIYADWRARLIEVLAFAEAGLDFSDEPIPADIEADVAARVAALIDEMAAQLEAAPVRERMRDGLRVALTGPPNVGKSSLLNALAERNVAIVAATPGTTRDVLEAKFDLGGYPVTLFDTAGIRETDDPVEREGVRRARLAASAADLVIDVRDATAAESGCAPPAFPAEPQATLVFWNKTDLLPEGFAGGGFQGSAVTGFGLDRLVAALTQAAKTAIEDAPTPAITRSRHRTALTAAVEALQRFGAAPAPELAAEDLRAALRSLGRVVGVVDVEDILDQVFATFCIGK